MKVFVVVLSCLALVAASDWRRGNVGRHFYTNQWMGDQGLDESSSYIDLLSNRRGRNLYDSGENMGAGIDSREQYSTQGNLIQRHLVQTVDNVDKKYGKYDDELKYSILNDKNVVLKQKFILDVLRNVHQTWTPSDINQDRIRIVQGESNYKNSEKVIELFHMLRNKNGLLPQRSVYSINNKLHRKQTAALFNLFYYSKDFNVFQQNVLWASRNVNHEMFVQALTAAVLHRDDCVGIKLPALYEIVPHKFHTSTTIEKALSNVNAKTGNVNVILNKNTNDYVSMNDEGKLAYLTEDIGWNLYHYYFHVDFASWIGGKDFNLYKERRGEKYLNLIQQLLARYNLERVSNGLGNIKDISLWTKVKTGYNPQMRYANGLPVTIRNNYYDIQSTEDYDLMNRVVDSGRRIRDAIDKGYCTTRDGGKVDLKRPEAIDILGNLIQSNKDSVNTQLYGGYIPGGAKLLGGGHIKNVDENNLIPSVMEHHETALRDPVTYQLYKKIIKFYYKFKDNLPEYKKEDLYLNGVRVDNIKTTKLVTYFDHFDVDITNIINTDSQNENVNAQGGVNPSIHDGIIQARHTRLNHKPFTVYIDLTCDHPQKVVVRTFLGPKYDSNGKPIKLRNNRENFVEIDKVTRDLQVGRHTIQRNSRDFVYTVKDQSTIVDIYKQVLVNNDSNKLIDMNVDEAHCGFPDRLVLPKGWIGGMPLQIFVIVTKAKDVVKTVNENTVVCGKHTVINNVDDMDLGFPFDRRIDENEFYTTNMLFKDVNVYHNTDDMIRNTVDMGGVRGMDSLENMNIQINN